jgi:peptidoglycan hydrolase-like protein with peptidoglycan-binding domain
MRIAEPDDRLTENSSAYIEAAYVRAEAREPIARPVDQGSAPSRIAEAQRIMRFLGYYRGRTNGLYDKKFQDAVLAFQKIAGIVASAADTGAGRIGPKTRDRLVLVWRRKHAQMGAERLLAMRKIDRLIADRGLELERFLSAGDRGTEVRALQKFLADKHYLAAEDVTGTFGGRTREALIAYQRDSGIIKEVSDAGAGFAGPATLAKFRSEMRKTLIKVVREKGWDAI